MELLCQKSEVLGVANQLHDDDSDADDDNDSDDDVEDGNESNNDDDDDDNNDNNDDEKIDLEQDSEKIDGKAATIALHLRSNGNLIWWLPRLRSWQTSNVDESGNRYRPEMQLKLKPKQDLPSL